VTVLAEHFERAADFSLTAYWAARIAEFRAGLHQGEATIRLSPAGRERIADVYDAEVARAVDATAGQPDQGGWITATVPIESLQNAQTEFLRLSADIEILTPASSAPGCRQQSARSQRSTSPPKMLAAAHSRSLAGRPSRRRYCAIGA
jgi:hypothetical protein